MDARATFSGLAELREDSPVAQKTDRPTPIRVLTLTTLFPNSRRPRHGIFVANRLRRLCDTGRIRATVIAAIPSFPAHYRETATVPSVESINGFEVLHPRFVNVPRIGMRLQPDLLARALLKELQRRGLVARQFDLVDAQYFYPDGVAGAQVAAVLGLPLVITARGSDINLIGDIPFARKRMVNAAYQADALVAVSAALANKMTLLGMPRDRIHVIRNGVDTSLFAPFSRTEARRRFGMSGEGRYVLGVGNLVPDKGFDLLIRAAAALDDVRTVIVGEGPSRGALQTLAREIAPDRVEFRDNMPQSELRYLYAAANVLGLPSLREGWPNVILEAIACGTPVVASAIGGVPEILRADAPAHIVSGRDVSSWRNALRNALDSAPSQEHVHRYALGFGWDDVATQQCELYERVVGGRRSMRGHVRSVTPCG